MPFQLNQLDNLALAGANIALDAKHYDLNALDQALKGLQGKGKGSVTVKNADVLAPNDLLAIATALGNRVTFQD